MCVIVCPILNSSIWLYIFNNEVNFLSLPCFLLAYYWQLVLAAPVAPPIFVLTPGRRATRNLLVCKNVVYAGVIPLKTHSNLQQNAYAFETKENH